MLSDLSRTTLSCGSLPSVSPLNVCRIENFPSCEYSHSVPYPPPAPPQTPKTFPALSIVGVGDASSAGDRKGLQHLEAVALGAARKLEQVAVTSQTLPRISDAIEMAHLIAGETTVNAAAIVAIGKVVQDSESDNWL